MRGVIIVGTSLAIFFGGAASTRAQEAPDPASVERIRAARSVRVDFSGVSGPGMVTADLPVQTTAEKLLGYGGLRLERQAPDLIVSINFSTQAVRQTHNRQVFGAPIGTMELVVRYTRAVVNGSIELRPGSGPSVFARFNGAAEDPFFSHTATAGRDSRAGDIDAPFEEAFDRVFVPAMFTSLINLFGARVATGALGDSDLGLRSGALRALSDVAAKGDRDAMTAIVNALGDREDRVRSAAHGALVSLKEAASEPLLARMNDPDPAVRARIIKVLGEIGGSGAVAAAIAALGSADPALRVDAVTTLSGMTYRTKVETMAAAVEPLIQIALGDPDRNARKYAASTLAKLRDARAIEPLIKMVEDKDRELQDAAAQALAELTGQRFGRNARRWREWLAKRPR